MADVIKPSSPQEFSEALKQAASRNRSITVGGNFSKNHYGGAQHPVDVVLSTARLNQLIEYQPADLTISVQAGMPWQEFTELLHRNHQMVPLDPPYAEQSTVGGVLACNLSGPRRRRFGTARDLVIGMEFVTLEGKVVQTGGMVVKNVAGLDMGKLMIGSMGTLAAITSANFKLNPLPESTRTFVFRFRTLEEALATRDVILRSELQPIAIDLLSQHPSEIVGLSGSPLTMLVQASGSSAVLRRFQDKWIQADALAASQEAEVWTSVRNLSETFSLRYPTGAIVRISSAIGDLFNGLESLKVPFLTRAGSGVSYAFFSDLQEAETWSVAAANKGVRSVIESSPSGLKSETNLWPDPGSDFDLMTRVKGMFDPEKLLNRGRLYGRI